MRDETKHIFVSGEYGFLTRAGLRQLLVDGGAVTVPKEVKYIGLTITSAGIALGELVDNPEWCERQREKAKIYRELLAPKA